MKKLLLLAGILLFSCGISIAQTTEDTKKTTVKKTVRVESKGATCKEMSRSSCCKKANAANAEAKAEKKACCDEYDKNGKCTKVGVECCSKTALKEEKVKKEEAEKEDVSGKS